MAGKRSIFVSGICTVHYNNTWAHNAVSIDPTKETRCVDSSCSMYEEAQLQKQGSNLRESQFEGDLG